MKFAACDMFRPKPARCRMERRRGTILITTMAICFALAAVVLVISRKMAVEAMASANQAAAAQANAIELGAEEYVKALLITANASGSGYNTILDPDTYTEDYFAALELGQQGGQSDGWFWLVRPVYDGNDDLPLFGLVDECSKLDINFPGGAVDGTAPLNADQAYNSLLMLPGMTEEVAAGIVDWRDTDTDPYNGIGAEDEYYLALPDAYYTKNSTFESVDELLMVRYMYRAMLFGDGTSSPMGRYSDTLTAGGGGPGGLDDPQALRGWYDLLTVDGYSPAPPNSPNPNTPARGLINVNTAPRAVLYCVPNLDPSDADTLVAYRTQNNINGGNTTDATWVSQAISMNANQASQVFTGQSNRYSADIVAVSHDGRAFKRVRIVIDTTKSVTLADGTTTTSPTIISRHDMTDQGWPMDPEVLASIRRGDGPPAEVGGSNNTVIGGTLR